MIPRPILQKAIDTAKQSDVKRAKIGAVLFTSNGHVVSFANNRRFNSVNHPSKWTIHAEEYLIAKATKIKASQRFGKLCILVARWSKKHGISMAKPCYRCQELLRETDWQVFYTDKHGEIRELL